MKPPKSTIDMINRLVKMRSEIEDVDANKLKAEIKKRYLEEFQSEETKKYTFDDENEKFAYVNGVIENEFTPVRSGKADSITAIPIGMTQVKKTKNKKSVWASLLIGEVNGKSYSLRELSVNGQPACKLLEKVQFGMKYNIKIRSDKEETRFFLDQKTNFNLPEQVDGGIRKLIRKFGFKEVVIGQARSNLSKIDEDTGYTIRTDLKILKGNVRYVNRGESKKTGDPYGRYTIFDGANPSSEYEITEDGVTVTTDFDIFCPYDMAIHDPSSVCEFVGTIRMADAVDATENYPAQPERPVMDAILVIAIVSKGKDD